MTDIQRWGRLWSQWSQGTEKKTIEIRLNLPLGMQYCCAWVQCSNYRAETPYQINPPWQWASASGTYSCTPVSYISAPTQAFCPYLHGKQVLADILMPISNSRFFNKVWERRPLFISRPSLRQWYSSWLSEDKIFDVLSKAGRHGLKYGYNLDVTTYTGTVSPVSTI